MLRAIVGTKSQPVGPVVGSAKRLRKFASRVDAWNNTPCLVRSQEPTSGSSLLATRSVSRCTSNFCQYCSGRHITPWFVENRCRMEKQEGGEAGNSHVVSGMCLAYLTMVIPPAHRQLLLQRDPLGMALEARPGIRCPQGGDHREEIAGPKRARKAWTSYSITRSEARAIPGTVKGRYCGATGDPGGCISFPGEGSLACLASGCGT